MRRGEITIPSTRAGAGGHEHRQLDEVLEERRDRRGQLRQRALAAEVLGRGRPCSAARTAGRRSPGSRRVAHATGPIAASAANRKRCRQVARPGHPAPSTSRPGTTPRGAACPASGEQQQHRHAAARARSPRASPPTRRAPCTGCRCSRARRGTGSRSASAAARRRPRRPAAWRRSGRAGRRRRPAPGTTPRISATHSRSAHAAEQLQQRAGGDRQRVLGRVAEAVEDERVAVQQVAPPQQRVVGVVDRVRREDEEADREAHAEQRERRSWPGRSPRSPRTRLGRARNRCPDAAG